MLRVSLQIVTVTSKQDLCFHFSNEKQKKRYFRTIFLKMPIRGVLSHYFVKGLIGKVAPFTAVIIHCGTQLEISLHFRLIMIFRFQTLIIFINRNSS